MKITSIFKERWSFLVLVCCCGPLRLAAQGDSAKAAGGDSTKQERESLIYLRYYATNNHVPYLNVQTKNKIDNAFHAQEQVPVRIYLDNDSNAESLVARVVTNEKGVA